MDIPIFQVDAFTSDLFGGNPAAVCLLEEWPDDSILQSIGAENNLSETAFLVPVDGAYELRWFTPTVEVALCGHATLAAAHVLFDFIGYTRGTITFRTRMSGELQVSKEEGQLELNFPAAPVTPITPPPHLLEALGVDSGEVFSAGEDVMVVLDEERAVRELQPDIPLLAEVECRGVIVTAPGEEVDFVSRFFCPRVGIAEDPVTGSAHTALIPYWADHLGKDDLHAFQVSSRGGELFCRNEADRVRIAGNAVLYLTGTISL